MALVQCPECGKVISSFAQACPNCGYPMSEDPINNDSFIYEESDDGHWTSRKYEEEDDGGQSYDDWLADHDLKDLGYF